MVSSLSQTHKTTHTSLYIHHSGVGVALCGVQTRPCGVQTRPCGVQTRPCGVQTRPSDVHLMVNLITKHTKRPIRHCIYITVVWVLRCVVYTQDPRMYI